MAMRALRTYRREVTRLPGESERNFTRRAELAIPDLKRYVESRHPMRHLRALVKYSADMAAAVVEVSALKEGWEA